MNIQHSTFNAQHSMGRGRARWAGLMDRIQRKGAKAQRREVISGCRLWLDDGRLPR